VVGPESLLELLVETLLQSPFPYDYVQLASAPMQRSQEKYGELAQQIEQGREDGDPPRELADYAGSYVGSVASSALRSCKSATNSKFYSRAASHSVTIFSTITLTPSLGS
jgi:hypothetical protein